jgi:hypothetical protein
MSVQRLASTDKNIVHKLQIVQTYLYFIKQHAMKTYGEVDV